MIWKELNDNLIFTKLHVSDNKEVLQILGNAMLREGYVEEGFTEALLEREKDYPTGLDVDGIGVAIPHTDTAHVKKEGIALAVLNEPVAFDAMGEVSGTIPVRIVVLFTVAGAGKQIDRLLQILDVIKNKENLLEMLRAKTSEEIRSAVQNHV